MTRRGYRYGLMIALVAVVAACSRPTTAPPPTQSQPTTAATTAGKPTTPPATTPAAPGAFPLAVVTGMSNLKANISPKEIVGLATSGDLVLPCGVLVTQPTLPATATASVPCVAPDKIAATLKANQSTIALLPPGLVEPATKVLSIAGAGPYGMFGPDLFGDKAARALPYPIQATAQASATFKPEWAAYDSSKVWTLTNIGSLCSDRGAAEQAVINGKGWHYVFNGGTARYAAPAVVDPPYSRPYRTVRPIETGHDGATAQVVKGSDVSIADHECPLVPTASYKPQLTHTTVFSVPEAVVTEWQNTLGVDIVYLAANHLSDKGVGGIRSTLEILDRRHLKRTGLGMNLDQALEPAYVDVAGIKVAVVAFNDVPGVARADAGTPGVPWITQANINEGVRRARAGGANLVICSPQFWGGSEYHDDLKPMQKQQLTWFAKGGCDHVLGGSGTHVAGPLVLTQRGAAGVGATGVSATLSSPGNFVFGQDWWQETQEGVILDLTFRGTALVNVRLRPTVMIHQARPALLDPEGDGRYVLQRVVKYSTLDYAP